MDKNIWVVDDDESIRWVLEKGLAESGMDVKTFDSANKVIKKLETENPQLILTDIRMPGPSGIELLDKVKELRPDIRGAGPVRIDHCEPDPRPPGTSRSRHLLDDHHRH